MRSAYYIKLRLCDNIIAKNNVIFGQYFVIQLKCLMEAISENEN